MEEYVEINCDEIMYFPLEQQVTSLARIIELF